MCASLIGEFVLLDLETTALQPERAEVIEVAAVRLRDGKPVARFSSFVRPMGPIPAESTRLTGITDEMLRDAPVPEVVARRFTAFLGAAPRVAHNADFDRDMLRVLCGREDLGTWLDTCELACFLRPELPSHALARLCAEYGLPEAPHRAAADVDAILAVLSALLADRRLRVEQLDDLVRPLKGTTWGWLPTLEALRDELARRPPRTADAKPTRPAANGGRPAGGAASAGSSDELQEIFGPGGRLSQRLAGAEVRPQQLEMAREVSAALAEKRHALVEAPTGIGKSLAYLVPAVQHALEQGSPVLVSTYTRALQDQLDEKDLPLVRQVLGAGLTWQVLKGAANYLCRRRWLELVDDLPKDAPLSSRLALAYLGSLGQSAALGDLERLSPYLGRRYEELDALRREVRSTGCGGERHASCPQPRARALARECDIVVLNHTLLFSGGARQLPEASAVVLDEAHQLEDQATSAFTQRLEGRAIDEVLRALRPSRGVGLVAQLGGGTKGRGGAYPNAQRLFAAHDGLETCGRTLGELLERLAAPAVDEDAPTQSEWAFEGLAREVRTALIEAVRALEKALVVLRAELGAAAEWVGEKQGPRPARSQVRLARRIEDLVHAIDQLLEQAQSFCEAKSPEQVRIVATELGRRPGWTLQVAPLEVAGLLREALFDGYDSVVLTSATLSSGDDGQFVRARIGLPTLEAGGPPLLQLGSPWDLERAATSYCVDDLPPLRPLETRVQAFARLVRDVAVQLGGRTLVLFGARQRLEASRRALEPLLAPQRIAVVAQGDGHGPDKLARMLRETPRCVALGNLGAWTGIDVPGPELSCVIIERLPFAPPARPLTKARSEAIVAEGGNAFFDYQLPGTLMTLRQGAGRLLRASGDRGLVLLCHEGLSAKNYWRRVQAVLPGTWGGFVTAARVEEVAREAIVRLELAP